MNTFTPHLQHNAFQYHERLLKSLPYILIAVITDEGMKGRFSRCGMTECRVLEGKADVSGDQAQRST